MVLKLPLGVDQLVYSCIDNSEVACYSTAVVKFAAGRREPICDHHLLMVPIIMEKSKHALTLVT